MYVKVTSLHNDKIEEKEFTHAVRCGFMQQLGLFVVEMDGREFMFHPQSILMIEKDLEKIALGK
jgi:hypothetical protein